MFYVQTPKEAVLYRIVLKPGSFLEEYIEIARFPTYEEAKKHAASLSDQTSLILSWEKKKETNHEFR